MNLKKKLLIALLSTTCVAAGAVGLAACNKDKDPEPKPEQSGSTATSCYVTAVDQNDNPVEGVTFRIGYYDSSTYSTKYVSGVTGTTDENGVAHLEFYPEDGVNYSVYLNDGDQRAYPYGYKNNEMSVAFDEDWKATYTFKYVPSSYYDNYVYALDYKRTFDDSDYDGEDAETMKYVEEGEGELTLDLKSGIHTYFSFLAYKELGSEGYVQGNGSKDEEEAKQREQIDYNQLWATLAAAGKYTVTFETSSSATVTMYQFAGTGYVATDADGVPTNKIGTTNSSTTSISFELTAAGSYSRAGQYFGISASADCTVKITVERTGDAVEPEKVETTVVQAPTGLTKYEDQSGVLTLMNVDGSVAAVLGDDGYYHVGTVNGPVLLVNLTEVLDRVGTCSIMDLANPAVNPYFNTGHVFSVYTDNVLTAVYDYSEFLTAYAATVNSDGVCPVDKNIYEFLQLLANKGQMTEMPKKDSPAFAYAWLLPCQFYAPAAGLPVSGSGTEADPYILLGLKNTLSSLSGTKAYLTYTATTDGVYLFELDENAWSTLSVSDADIKAFSASKGDITLVYVPLSAGQTVNLELNISDLSTSIEVSNVAEAVLKAVSTGSSNVYDDDGNIIGTEDDSEGTTADNAIYLSTAGYSVFVVDKEVNDGVWIYVRPLLGFNDAKNYVFSVKAPFAQIVYNGQTYGYGNDLVIENVENNVEYKLFLTAKDGSNNVANGLYVLEWISEDAEASSSDDGSLKLGENYPKFNESYTIETFEFTAEEGGWYRLKVENGSGYDIAEYYGDPILDGSWTYEDTDDDYNYGPAFYLEAGDSIMFDIQVYSLSEDTPIIVEKTVQPQFVLNKDYELTVGGFNEKVAERVVNIDETSTYTFTAQQGRGSFDTITVTIDGTDYVLTADNASIEVDLTAGEHTVKITSNNTRGGTAILFTISET